jgi:hypothetical protein
MIAARREYHKYSPSYHQSSRAPPKLTDVRAFRCCARNLVDGGSADPEKNIALFNVVKKARADGVPKTNIESALQKVRICVMRTFLSLLSLLLFTLSLCFLER